MSPDQTDLFGTVAPPPAGIGACEPDPALTDLAARLPCNLRLGTCSWSYPGWQGLVFDRAATESRLAREGLPAYCRHPLLRTVSLDRAFYQPLSAADYARYAAQAPAGFRFVVKAWRALTDPQLEGRTNPHFLDAAFALGEIAEPILEGLGDAAGVLLVQFPPGLTRRSGLERTTLIARIGDVLEVLARWLPVAVEIRSPELLDPEWFDMLVAVGAVHAPNAHPTMPPPAEQATMMRTVPFLFLRWMLRPGDVFDEAAERYAPFDRIQDANEPMRAQLAALCRAALGHGRDVWVIADNKAEGSAPLSLFELARRIAGADGSG